MKGISPLIAAVLLIAFTVAIGGIVSVFFTSFTKQTTGSVGSQGQQLITCSGAVPSVDKVSYGSGGTGVMNVTFSNPSIYNITNVSVYTTFGNGATFANGTASSGTWWLNPLGTNSTMVITIAGYGAPIQVMVSGMCGTSSVSGVCLTGQTCMVGV
jgi:flagellin-like protein